MPYNDWKKEMGLKEKTEMKAAKQKPLSSFDVINGDDILTARDKLRAVLVATPEWAANGAVHVAELSADERDAMEIAWAEYKESLGEEDNAGFRAFAVAFCICSETRERLFAGREAVVAQAIGGRNGKATCRLFNTISRINGLTKADVDALEGN